MNWIMENIHVVVVFVVIAATIISALLGFFKLPGDKQKAKIKEWLIWACIEAEKALQSGTGQLKLRDVWNRFCQVPAFSFIAKLISFDTFSLWVADALKEAKTMLMGNSSLAEYVYGENYKTQIDKLKEQVK